MHPLLRAYVAGIALPTMVMPFVIVALAIHRAGEDSLHLAEIVIFPIGLVPNAWGLWNALYVNIRRSREIPIGLFGAALVFVIGPAAFALQLALDRVVWTPELMVVGVPTTLVLYYLAWKHVVARFNILLGIG